ncbi:MAG: 3-oxoacyl-[acyl-carrier-protein] synthase III C-terminal domain-containing protein, partial [Pseudomonadota bacterium]
HRERVVDVVHTEACSLHASFADDSKEQMIVNSLFSDGIVKYQIGSHLKGRRLVLRHYEEQMIPGTEEDMSWKIADSNLAMTLARSVPKTISAHIEDFVSRFDLGPSPVFAVHPGGPSIIDAIGDVLNLSDSQLALSRHVFFENGNMSSATLPYIWKEVLDQGEIAPGKQVMSLAFGPGLTMCGALFEVVE